MKRNEIKNFFFIFFIFSFAISVIKEMPTGMMTGIAQDRTAQRSAGRKGRRQWVVRGFLGECRMTSCPSRHFIMKSFGIYYFVYVVPFEILPSFAALLMATVEKSSELLPKCRTLKMWVKFRSLIGGPDFLNVETKEIIYYFLLNLSQAWNGHSDFLAVEYLLSRFCWVYRAVNEQNVDAQRAYFRIGC